MTSPFIFSQIFKGNMMTSKNEVKAIIQTKHGITKHVNINGKIIISAKYIIAGILLHVFARTLYI